MRQGECKIFDSEAAGQPLALIMGADGEYRIDETGVVEVVGIDLAAQTVEQGHRAGIGVQKRAVGLQAHNAAIGHHLAVQSEETCAGEALGDLLHLWIGEGDP